MKFATILFALALSSLGQVFGLGIDVENLGHTFNGWSEKRTASYTVDGQTYRTHVPSVSQNLDGGIFVSMRVDHLSAIRPDATAYLELTFTPSGYVGAAQIRVTMNGEKYDTGQILRPEEKLAEEGKIGSADWRSTNMKLVLALFSKLDAEFTKEEEEVKTSSKRDLWGRLNGSRLEEANVSAALRHNLNSLLLNVGYQYGGK